MKPRFFIVVAAATGFAAIAVAASHAMPPHRSEAAAALAWRGATEPPLTSFLAPPPLEYRVVARDGAAAAAYRDRSPAKRH
jgi:hypothetical protein